MIIDNKKYLFFDLDGTLTDPGIGITNSVMYALKRYNIEVKDRSELYSFIGPPLKDSFMKYFDFSESDAMDAIAVYREYFSTKGLFENEVYDGMAEALGTLVEAGHILVVATSKPEKFAKEIIEHFNLDKYFELVCGATFDEKRTKKGDVIAYAIEALGIKDKNDILMIGDREHDIFGAKENGLASLGVTWGYGSREELENAGADEVIDKVSELTGTIKKS